ncbi:MULTISPECIES: DUF4928 family protein [Micromonospora]|uniref:DUF4928 family protein n=1 Tax=Micromonospora TaxID=1873 RepID=UPI0005B81454|nr:MULTISPECIES: DUF4928 family protein [Micromonospora]MCK1843499.1 DUF4928 family protein [Micromonospora sp. R42004]MCM1019943.1 DUF4928 family protein [Micromonospora sp. XM-20-01]WBB83735.1 DUF4928 family protein [Micromonospora sp. WMMC264]
MDLVWLRAEPIVEDLINSLEDWRETKRNRKGAIDANVFCAGLYVTEHLGRHYPLSRSDYLSESQVKGAGGPQAQRILRKHGEERPFLKEGGRTSRMTKEIAVELVSVIDGHPRSDDLRALSEKELGQVATTLQAWFVDQIKVEYFGKQRLKTEFVPATPIKLVVAAVLRAAHERGGNTAGAVAQHLVGAKLALRFPALTIGNESYTTADAQTARPGDFLVGDTVIHVTMSPGQSLFEGRCKANRAAGYRCRVLVPEAKLAAALQLSELGQVGDYVAIQAVEDFVGTNVEEMAEFRDQSIRSGLRRLLETYNKRTAEAETDPSLLIELPENL